VYEAGGNMLSQALQSKTVSRNEIQEFKEIIKQENKLASKQTTQSGSVPSAQRAVNPETFLSSLKALGQTLGL